MTRLSQLATAFAVGALVLSPIAGATSASAAKMTKEERAAYNAKRADCKAKAKEQKLHLVKRYRFIKECMKG